MASYLRPRRGKKSTAESQAIVLKRGEVFFEVPDNGVGTGAGKIKMGDGSTSYASLPYFTESLNLDGDDATVAFTNTTAATDASNNATYLTNMAPTASLKTLFTNIKQLLFNYNSQLTSLNNELEKVGELEGPSCNGRFVPKNLGQITASNIANFVSEHGLATGQFKDIYPGCEVTIMDGTYNAVWVCAGLDTEYNRGDTACPHGASFIPKVPLFNAQINSTNTNSGGYVGSAMHKTTLPGVANKLKNALGGHLINRRVLLSNSASGWAWTDAYCTLLTENQVYGSRVWGTSYDTAEGDQILPIFKFINHVYYSRSHFWLRGLFSSTAFCGVDANGDASYNGASYSLGVLPLIVIG